MKSAMFVVPYLKILEFYLTYISHSFIKYVVIKGEKSRFSKRKPAKKNIYIGTKCSVKLDKKCHINTKNPTEKSFAQ